MKKVKLLMTQPNKSNKRLFLSTDGGARGNPGPAGAGFVLYNHAGEVIFADGKYLGENTNNVAEYTALILGLEKALEMNAQEIVIKMDSELIVKQMSGEYKIKQPHLQELAAEVRDLLKQFDSFEFKHVLRHLNKAADEQVNKAIDRALGLK